MVGIPADIAHMGLPLRCTVLGTVAVGTAGAIAGLILGLLANPPTAWFAVFEGGIPAAIVGGILGLLAGLLAEAARRFRRGTGARMQ